MTCEECKAVMVKCPTDCTTAEIAAVCRHTDTCKDCDDWDGQYTVSSREEFVAQFGPSIVRVLNDPEAIDVLMEDK